MSPCGEKPFEDTPSIIDEAYSSLTAREKRDFRLFFQHNARFMRKGL